eukprot:12492397-Alexandrium_andersonii.AAC.1
MLTGPGGSGLLLGVGGLAAGGGGGIGGLCGAAASGMRAISARRCSVRHRPTWCSWRKSFAGARA